MSAAAGRLRAFDALVRMEATLVRVDGVGSISQSLTINPLLTK